MKQTLAALLLACGFLSVQAQNGTVIPPNVRATNTLEDLGNLTPNEVLYGIPLPPKQLLGDAYLNPEWQSANILLFTRETLLEGYPVRYDLLKDELEVKSKNGIKVLEGKRVKSFVWMDSATRKPEYFINASQYTDSDKLKMTGFFEVLADGKFPLLSKPTATIREADYNVQFNVGSRDDKIVKKQTLYFVKDGVAYEVPKSRKKFLAIFGDDKPKVEEFVKINTLDTSDKDHVKRIFIHYNSLN
jgi:hypothetical protein